MTTFAINMKHVPESCPRFNDEVRKKFNEAIAKRGEIAKKYDVKVLNGYVSTIDHTTFYLVEAPSQQSVESYFLDAGFAFWNTVDISQVVPIEGVIKMLSQK
jgi:hypothetical protein